MSEEYFIKLHNGDDDVMRFLLYTPADVPKKKPPLGAGAHSDYGTCTLLFQGISLSSEYGADEMQSADYKLKRKMEVGLTRLLSQERSCTPPPLPPLLTPARTPLWDVVDG